LKVLVSFKNKKTDAKHLNACVGPQ